MATWVAIDTAASLKESGVSLSQECRCRLGCQVLMTIVCPAIFGTCDSVVRLIPVLRWVQSDITSVCA